MLRSRLPLLVTGIAGVAGFNAFRELHNRYPGQVIGIRPKKNWGLRGAGVAAQEAEEAVGMRRLFDQYGFRSVLNCAGNCALKSCELDPIMARRVNVASAVAIADNVRRHGARLVHLSSDLVFSGTASGNHVETDPVDPVTIYGTTMVEAERHLTATVPECAILRISLPMGPSFNHHAGAIDWIQSRFRANRPATLYFDEVRSCTYCDDLTHVCEAFLANDATGIYHAGGPRAITLYEIAQVVNRVGGYDPTLLKGCPRHEAGPMPPRAGNCSMDSSRLIGVLGEEPFRGWPVGDDILPTHRDWHHDRPDFAGSVEEIARRLYRYVPVRTHSIG